jgi:hypothetical protein
MKTEPCLPRPSGYGSNSPPRRRVLNTEGSPSVFTRDKVGYIKRSHQRVVRGDSTHVPSMCTPLGRTRYDYFEHPHPHRLHWRWSRWGHPGCGSGTGARPITRPNKWSLVEITLDRLDIVSQCPRTQERSSCTCRGGSAVKEVTTKRRLSPAAMTSAAFVKLLRLRRSSGERVPFPGPCYS